MLSGRPVMIVEDDILVASMLATGVKKAGGTVVGPVDTVREALALLNLVPVAGAILDGNLADRDVSPIALRLLEQGVPVIIYSGREVPASLSAWLPAFRYIRKPAPVERIITELAALTEAAAPGVSFTEARILVDGGIRIGQMAHMHGCLAGVLIPVSGDETGDGAAGWYLEAGFGSCSALMTSTPNAFADLPAAADWFNGLLRS
jgi:DNA-binding NtrC family response regulator